MRLIDPEISPVDPIPRSGRSGPDAWLDAEAALAGPLAEAAEAFARLDERLRAWDPAHARAGVERLALWAAWRIGRSGEEDAGLARAAWAARRLARRRWTLASSGAVARFEGRTLLADAGEGDDLGVESQAFARVRGDAWIAAAEAWSAEVRGLRAAHRFTQACVAERAWRLTTWSSQALRARLRHRHHQPRLRRMAQRPQ